MNTLGTQFYIVDDDVSFGKSLKRLLNALGYPAVYFSSAQRFLELVPPSQVSIAILDISMPECDGFELMKKMQQLHFAMNIILITGQPLLTNWEVALQKGAIGLLQKPFETEALLELIRLHVDKAGSA